MASLVVLLSLDQVVQVEVLAGGIVLCFYAKHFNNILSHFMLQKPG